MTHWLAVFGIGAVVGFLGGLFGKGGSAIATPMLAAIGVAPIVAVATPLPATIPGTLVAYNRYRKLNLSDPRVIRWSLAFGVPATVLGAALTRYVGGHALVVVTDIVVALLGLRVLLGSGADPEVEPARLTVARMVAVAVTVGLVSGLLANAGGFLLVPLYLAVLHLPIKRALSSSLAVASVLAVPGTIVHAALGHIDWKVALVFGAASVPLSGIGATVALRMDTTRLERVYGAGLVVMGVAFLIIG